MGMFDALPSTAGVACSPGELELVIGDIPPIPAPFTGPEMCPPDCGDGPIYQEVRKCSDDPEDGAADVLVGAFVDGVWTPGASTPAGYVPCSTCAEQVEVTTKIPQWLPVCIDWCESWLVCVTTGDDGTSTYGPWKAADGTEVSEAPGVMRFGSCPIGTKETKSVWTLPVDECPVFVRFVDVVCAGPKTLTYDAAGGLVPLVLGDGEVLFPEDQAFGKCVTCEVAPATFYAADTVAVVKVYSESCEFDCETGQFTDPTTVTVGGVTHEVPAGEWWCTLTDPAACGPCVPLIGKDITIDGPATVWAWTVDPEDC